MKSSIVKSIKSLPPLPKTIMEINRVCADEEGSIAELAKVISHDPMIVANLLKSANSSLYGFGKEIKNVMQAVSLFGMSTTRSIALGNSVRKLLNADMQPYGITSEKFAEILEIQATLMHKWYFKVDKQKADNLFLAAFLQETGKILIASYIIQKNEEISFQSEVAHSNNLVEVEKSYVDASSSEITAAVFDHWGFDKKFIEMIHYADTPSSAPEYIEEYAMALHIVKMIVSVNKPFTEQAINFGLRKARDVGYDSEVLKGVIDTMEFTYE